MISTHNDICYQATSVMQPHYWWFLSWHYIDKSSMIILSLIFLYLKWDFWSPLKLRLWCNIALTNQVSECYYEMNFWRQITKETTKWTFCKDRIIQYMYCIWWRLNKGENPHQVFNGRLFFATLEIKQDLAMNNNIFNTFKKNLILF